MQVRYATAAAAEGWAGVLAASSPWEVGSAASVLHDMECGVGTLARYVAVEDGEVLGGTRVRLGPPGEVRAAVHVHPDHRGRGVGAALFARVLLVADGKAVSGIVAGDDASRGVARHWGFTFLRELSISTVQTSALSQPTNPPAGFRVVTLAEVGAQPVWACHEAAVADDPSGLTRLMPFDEYAATQWDEPTHRADLGRAVIDEDTGTVASYTSVDVAGTRAWNTMTATRPRSRDRGYAALAKAHCLQALAAAGVTVCSTGNDAANAAMLAVNSRLGYTRTATAWRARRPGR